MTGRVDELPEALGPPPGGGRFGLALAATLFAAAALGAAVWGYGRLRSARIGVEAAWLARDPNGAPIAASVDGAGDLYYHVRLVDVPMERPLEVECEWFDGAGVTVRLNHFETRTVDHDPWTTHCRCPMSGGSPGAWRVVMSVEGRAMSETAFDVGAR